MSHNKDKLIIVSEDLFDRLIYLYQDVYYQTRNNYYNRDHLEHQCRGIAEIIEKEAAK